MFKKYQQLIIIIYSTNKEIKVYFLADYKGLSRNGNQYPVTKIICQELQTNKIYHIEPIDIVGIIDGVI